MSSDPQSRHRAAIAALLVALTLAALAPVLGNEFISYDDEQYVTRNHHVRAGLTLDGMLWAFGADAARIAAQAAHDGTTFAAVIILRRG